MTFDDARAAHPGFGFAVYAYEPHGAVTMEIHAPDGARFVFTGPTLAAVLGKAFPAPETPPAENVFD